MSYIPIQHAPNTHFSFVVRLPFETPADRQRKKSRKRISRVVAILRRRLTKVMGENHKLQKTVWTLRKRDQRRTKINITPNSPGTPAGAPPTPVKKADEMLRQNGMSSRKVRSLRKTLSLHHVFLKELASLDLELKSRLLKSASCTKTARLLSRSLNISRKPSTKKAETQRSMSAALTKRHIQAFMKSPENATCLPGKRDVVTVKGKKLQKYILTDNLLPLWRRYIKCHPNRKVSYALFKKSRPVNVLPVCRTQRGRCVSATSIRTSPFDWRS